MRALKWPEKVTSENTWLLLDATKIVTSGFADFLTTLPGIKYAEGSRGPVRCPDLPQLPCVLVQCALCVQPCVLAHTAYPSSGNVRRAFWDHVKALPLAKGCGNCNLFILLKCYFSLKHWENSLSGSCVQLYVLTYCSVRWSLHCPKSLTPCSSSIAPFQGDFNF